EPRLHNVAAERRFRDRNGDKYRGRESRHCVAGARPAALSAFHQSLRERRNGMFKRIDHVEIVTDQPERTERFYTDVLGFRVKARDRVQRPDGAALNLVYLDLGGTTVELIAYEGVSVDPM